MKQKCTNDISPPFTRGLFVLCPVKSQYNQGNVLNLQYAVWKPQRTLFVVHKMVAVNSREVDAFSEGLLEQR